MKWSLIVFCSLALPMVASAQSSDSIEVVDHSHADSVDLNADGSAAGDEEAKPPDPNATATTNSGAETTLSASPPAAPAAPIAPGPTYTPTQAAAHQPMVGQLSAPNRDLLRVRLAEHSIGGPIAMVAAGYPLGLIFAGAAYYAWQAEDVVDCIADDCNSPSRVASTTLGIIGIAGLTVAIIGTILLAKRVRARVAIRRAFSDGTLSANGFRLRF